MLAESLPKVSADGKRYSITLRKGVQLHNGRELNAEDGQLENNAHAG